MVRDPIVCESGVRQLVAVPMYPSECRRYAEQCLQLAEELAPEHRDLLLELAQEWRKAAEELEEFDESEN
jgi:hypothetical protein